jgi:cytoskeletal protein CcmA (bactofilin family)
MRERWTRVVASEDSAQTIDAAPSSPGTGTAAQPIRSVADGTFIGSGALFEGTLTLRGDFKIDTDFRGELETDGTITIETSGSVVGSIRAREVIIRGAVMGNVTAPRQLVVESTGKLHGDIETACLEIQKHAFFQGNTKMSLPQASRRAEEQSTERFAPLAPSLHAQT